MVGLKWLAEARAAGLTVHADGDRLVIRGPGSADAVAQKLLQHKSEVLAELHRAEAVEWRRAAMTPQVPRHGSIPFLIARDVAPQGGHCLSCGEPLDAGRLMRCGLCVEAAELVLNRMREEDHR